MGNVGLFKKRVFRYLLFIVAIITLKLRRLDLIITIKKTVKDYNAILNTINAELKGLIPIGITNNKDN